MSADITPRSAVSPPENHPLLVKSREAARLLGISERTLYTLRRQGRIPYVVIGQSIRYSVSALNRWIETNQMGAGRLYASRPEGD
jgi:excisionase family DNA binding protein